MRYINRFSPRGAVDAISDLMDYWRQPTPYRWQILGLSVAITFTLMVLFIPDSQRPEPRIVPSQVGGRQLAFEVERLNVEVDPAAITQDAADAL